jgi:dihydrofolate synthase/folylpolyglutamate synthase
LPDPFAWLHGLELFGIKFGLDNITAIVEELGHPERAFRAVHIAGTNGKGSVAAMVDAVLRAGGHRVGRYTSPHLLDLTERFVIDGRPVDRDRLGAVLSDLRAVIDRLRGAGRLDVHPTFFEVTTAAAFELFRRAAVAVAVCEVGLGGRLDATNVLLPEVTAITSIGLDHQQYLGQTLREIALEKAGILKPGIPVVAGKMDRAAFEAIAAAARDRDAPLLVAEIGGFGQVELGLQGAHQKDNAAVAVTVLEALNRRGIASAAAAISRGLEEVRWPGRLDRRRLPDGREALLDAAHNPDGARALAAFLETSPFKGSPLIFGASRDKDVARMLEILVPAASTLIVTRAGNARAADAVELGALARPISPGVPVVVASAVGDALAAAWRRSKCIVIAGSIFLLGDVMKEVGWS